MTVPAPTPLTTPEEEFTVAIVGLLLDQLPPVVASLSVIFAPTQTDDAPVIALTDGGLNNVILLPEEGEDIPLNVQVTTHRKNLVADVVVVNVLFVAAPILVHVELSGDDCH